MIGFQENQEAKRNGRKDAEQWICYIDNIEGYPGGRKRFKPTNPVVVHGIQQKMAGNFNQKKPEPFSQTDGLSLVPPGGNQGQEKTADDGKQEGVGNPPVCQQLSRNRHPHACNKIDIRNTVGQGTPQHGLATCILVKNDFSYAGTKDNMRE